ncbi:MAG: shikimate dehydrogenase [Chloroflexota bacterium]|nr:shikimate dehydrogenase [Chloroflexota bacterium]
MTVHCGVVGYPLAHSISPAFQQPAFEHLGLDVDYRAYETPPAALGAFVTRLRSPGWLGCNVTIPYKRQVLDLVDDVSEEARLIGAVNTVAKGPSGRLIGHNTDAAGFLKALVENAGFDPRDRDAVLLGAGGAALAVAVALLRAGVGRLWIANRTLERAQKLAHSLAEHFPSARLDVVALHGEALRRPLATSSLLVNTTSLGMAHGPAPERSPVSPALLAPHLVVYDLVYNPARTPLLEAAAAAGARTQEGLPMLIYQGALAFEHWTGQPAPVSVMMEQGRRALADRARASGQGGNPPPSPRPIWTPAPRA